MELADRANETTELISGVSNITESLSNDFEGLVSPAAFVVFSKVSLVFWLMISAFGICTNILNIRTFVRMGPEDSVTVLFLALSIADFFMCNFSFFEAASTVADIVSVDFNIVLTIHPSVVRLYSFAIRRILSVVSVLITMFLAIQRCLCVVIPFQVRGMFSRRLTYLFLMAAFIFAAVPYALYAAQYRVAKYFDPKNDMTRYKLASRGLRTSILRFVSVGMGIVLNVTAQVLINVCIIVMGYGLKKSVQFRKMASTEPGQKATGTDAPKNKVVDKERNILIQVIIVSIIFVLTNCPFLLISLAAAIEPKIDLYGLYSNLYVVIVRIMFVIETINSSFNFFIYYRYNSKFRTHCFRRKGDGKR